MPRIGIEKLRKIIFEETQKILLEAEKKEKEDGEDSLDAQVDKYLIDYESESKSSKNEGKDFRMFLRRFLTEAEGDEEEKDEEKKDEEKLTADDIDIDNFLESVVRLIDNYDSLLEVRSTILRRSINFLLDKYEPDVIQAFKDSLLDRYGMEVGKSKLETEDDQYERPTADRAGPGLGA